jgi:hypothetical protein
MNYDEIVSQFIEKDKKILYVGTPVADIFKSQTTPSELHVLDDKSFTDLEHSNFPKELDYVVFTDVLELVDNPKEVISKLKWNSKQVIVYEFKHYEDAKDVNPAWKKPWTQVGLENLLTWEFDYVRSLYLGYATIYFCESPNDIKPELLNAE